MEAQTFYRDLYYEWERGQWAAGSIDFEADRGAWPGLEPGLKEQVTRVVATSHLLAQGSTELLVPLVDAAPTEEQQVFLTTQLVDAARHAVLFEVIRGAYGLEDFGGWVDQEVEALIREDLTSVTARLHAAPQHHVIFAEALTLYQLTVATRVTAMQAQLSEALQATGQLPGLTIALGHVSRDVARHRAFAERFLAEREPV